jgi:H+/Cl- antiporter ClcA
MNRRAPYSRPCCSAWWFISPGVVRAPITGFVIVSEMSGDHGVLVAPME